MLAEKAEDDFRPHRNKKGTSYGEKTGKIKSL